MAEIVAELAVDDGAHPATPTTVTFKASASSGTPSATS